MSPRRRTALLIASVALVLVGAVVVALRPDGDDDGVTLRSAAPTTSSTSSTLVPDSTIAVDTTLVAPTVPTSLAVPTTTALRAVRATTTTGPAPSGPPVIEANTGDVAARGVYVGTVDGKLRRLADATMIGLDVSPDGRRIAFLNDHKLFVVGVDGKGLREVPGMGRVVNKWDNPAWSPDGRSVAAIRLDPDGGYRVAVSTDGGAGRVLDAGVAGVAAIDWAPDSSAVVAASGNAIWSAPVDGKPATKLTDTGTYNAGFVEFSPDGTKLAYAIYEALVVMAPDGSSPRKIASVPYGGYFAWSPDSTRLSHPIRGEPSSGLAVTPADGGASTTIVKEFAGPARWATSDLVAFSTQENDRSHIDVVRPDGSDRRRLVTDAAPSRLRADHVWDPTGSWVAFTSGTGGDGT